MKPYEGYVLIIVLIMGIVLILAGIWVYMDIQSNKQIKKQPSRPSEKIADHVDQVLYALENNLDEVPFEQLAGACDYIWGRYDCADFRIMPVLRILYVHAERLDRDMYERVKETLLGFRYWMDQPGEDGMCFWSENHQILFAAAEYLVGQRYPEETFSNTGKTGAEHMEIARERILIWLRQRWLYGFTEWYSNVYYVEDVAPLANLIEFSRDDEIVKKAAIIMDLLLYDVATQSYRGTFVSTSGRAYEHNRKSGAAGNSMKAVIQHVWGFPVAPDGRIGMDLCFVYMNRYKVPEALLNIGKDTENAVIKASNGLDLDELKAKKLIGMNTHQIMMQWAMEAFSNHPVIDNTVRYINANNLLSNEFLNGFKMVNIGLLKRFHLLTLVSRLLDPVSNGAAIQRANTYTCRTSDYLMATAQHYHPGTYGDQQHIFSVTLSDQVSLFHSHPAKTLSDEGSLSGSPGYWVGYGRIPHSVQYGHIHMSIYRLPDKKGFLEKSLVHFTHAYLPSSKMDEVVLNDRYAFARMKDVYVGIIGSGPLYYLENTDDDLIQQGKDVFWIFEMGTKMKEGSFDNFIRRIQGQATAFTKDRLVYEAEGVAYALNYRGDFLIDKQLVNTSYMRHDAPYAQNARETESMQFFCGETSLYLHFDQMIREEKM